MSVPIRFDLIACPGCDERGFTHASVWQHRGSGDANPLQIVRCDQCGLNYLNPRPTADALRSLYPEDYGPYRSRHGEVERRWKIVTKARLLVMKNVYGRPDLRRRGAKKLWATVMSWFKSPRSCGEAIAYRGSGRLLDFGCGSGTFLRRMRAMGWVGTGVDWSETPVQLVRDSGIVAHVSSLPCMELKEESFDLITMRHSLEHVACPREVLSAALDLLVPGGEVNIQVPNFQGWEIQHFGDASNMLDLPRHLIHWDESTLREMMRECGFEKIEVRQTCRPNSLRKSARRMKSSHASGLDRLMARSMLVCRWVAWRCERAGKGNELIATASKSATAKSKAAREGHMANALV